MMLSFTFSGKNSYSDYGLLIAKRPELPSPKRRVSYISIPGRSSSLRYDEETYEDITLAVECALKGDPYQRIDEIKAWLFGSGESDLIFSFQNDRKYIAQVVNSIDFAVTLKVLSKFIILFNCRPFKYAVQNEAIQITTGAGTSVFNPGTFTSRPLIKVYCTGNGNFSINGKTVNLMGLQTPHIVLDSELEEAYFEGTPLVNANNQVSGEFPELLPGNNTITYAGGVTKLQITPNWRWL